MSRGMKDSGIEWIGEIPKDWEVVRTKNVFSNYKEIVGDKVDNYERLSLTLNGVLKRSKEDSSGLQPLKFEGYQILKENQLVFKLIDLENVNTSRVGLSPYTGLVSPAYIVLDNKGNSKFGYYYFLSMWHREIFNKLGGDGVRSNLNVKDLLNIPYVLINQEEQQKIVNLLNERVPEINNIIDKTTQSIEEYKKYKQSIITEAVTKGLNPDVEMKDSGIEWIGEIPKHWNIKRLRYLGSLQNGISKGSDYFGFGYPFVSYGDVYKNMVLPVNGSGLVNSSETDRENYSVRQGDVFFTRTSETIEEVGFASTCLKTIEDAVFAGFVIRFRPFTDELNESYSKYYFRSEMHRRFFVKEMNLVTRASLSQELLKKLPVLIPSNEEQQQISYYLDKKCYEIDSLIAQKQKLLKDLESYKKSLIYECVTGKREV